MNMTPETLELNSGTRVKLRKKISIYKARQQLELSMDLTVTNVTE